MNKYILHIASWYPNKVNRLQSTFIYQQINTIKAIKKCIVISVVEGVDKDEIVKEDHENLIQVIYYLRLRSFPFRQYHYYSAYLTLFKKVVEEYGLPLLTHVHVAYKAAAVGWYIHFKYNIPYIVSEHFTAFTPQSKVKFKRFILWYSRRFTKSAEVVLPISEMLNTHLNNNGINHTKVVYNMIDPVFSLDSMNEKVSKTQQRFIHVSNLKENQKNIDFILRAFVAALEVEESLHLTIIGSNADRLDALKETWTHIPNISFKHGLPAAELSQELKTHDVLLMYSKYETFSMVIAEAIACGLYVISSNIEGPQELIVNDSIGKLVPLDNVTHLTNTIIQVARQERSIEDKKRNSEWVLRTFGADQFKNEIEAVYNHILD